MNKFEKLFRKLSKKDGLVLQAIIAALLQRKTQGLNIQKVSGTEFFRLKKRNFRILFHWEDKDIVIDSVRLRNEKTYKNL